MFNLRAFLGLTYYTSELDQFLKEFDKKHSRLSASQHKEIEKYKIIFKKRDNANQSEPKQKFWDKF